MFKIGDLVVFNSDNTQHYAGYYPSVKEGSPLRITDVIDNELSIKVTPLDSVTPSYSWSSNRFALYDGTDETPLTATVTSTSKTIVKTIEVKEEVINLQLTRREATLLANIFNKIGGNPDRTPRGEVDKISKRLKDINIFPSDDGTVANHAIYYGEYKGKF